MRERFFEFSTTAIQTFCRNCLDCHIVTLRGFINLAITGRKVV